MAASTLALARSAVLIPDSQTGQKAAVMLAQMSRPLQPASRAGNCRPSTHVAATRAETGTTSATNSSASIRGGVSTAVGFASNGNGGRSGAGVQGSRPRTVHNTAGVGEVYQQLLHRMLTYHPQPDGGATGGGVTAAMVPPVHAAPPVQSATSTTGGVWRPPTTHARLAASKRQAAFRTVRK